MEAVLNSKSGKALAAAWVVLLLIGSAWSAQAQEDRGPMLITLHADSTSVIEILEILADRSGLNIVAGSAVQGRKITLHLSETPFEEALNLVVRATGLGYERVGDSILVTDPSMLAKQTGFTSRVFDLDYADALEVGNVLEAIAPGIRVDARGDRVVIWATQSAVDEAMRVVDQLDRKPLQVLLESRLIEVNTTSLLEVGIDWERLTKWSTIITEGNHGPSSNDQIPDEIPFVKLGDSEDFYRQMEAYEVAIDFLLTSGNARLLANSKVVTLDGEPAEIFSGETVPVVITSLQTPGSAGGVFQTVQLEKIDVGVRLNITPRIASDGFITTLVEPSVSQIIGFVGRDNDLPQTSDRRAKALVRVRDGQKIYLGGLLTEASRKTVKKVPILGSIPLLGLLFRHTKDETIRLDLVIEITPHIVGDEGEDRPSAEALHPDLKFPEDG